MQGTIYAVNSVYIWTSSKQFMKMAKRARFFMDFQKRTIP